MAREQQYEAAPNPDDETVLKLWVRAGGRCSFPGCNEYLLHDGLTMQEIKHGHVAHIVGKSNSPRSPRGQHSLPVEERSRIDNLILLCQKHHSLVDNEEPEKFSVKTLRDYKRQHEERIFYLTDLSPNRKTTVVWFRAIIDGELVDGSSSDLTEALWRQGKYPSDSGIVIDLTQHPDGESNAFMQAGKELIDAKITGLQARGLLDADVRHVSVFALGPIPLLVYLGYKLSNKIPTDLYQRHHDTEDWCWKDEPSRASHQLALVREGTDLSKVALVLSLSGTINLADLPTNIDECFYVYEITLQNGSPNPMYLKTPGDLDDFKAAYYRFWAEISAHHPEAETIHFFPATPAPVAVMCGREMLKKVTASLTVYDNNKRKGGFVEVLEVGAK